MEDYRHNREGSITLQEFFRDFELKISDYQRPYVWSGKQAIKLCEDILDYSKREEGKPLYYIGTIILVKDEKSDFYDIIDGQQRLLTLLILDNVFKINSYTEDFQIESQQTENRIKKNAAYILSNFRDYEMKIDQTIFEGINLTYIIADNQDQAFKFYTTLNTSGKKLDGMDIVKPFHLQALDKKQQDEKAKEIEKHQFDKATVEDKSLFNHTAETLLKGRYWSGIDFKPFPRAGYLKWKDLLTEEFAFEEMPEDGNPLYARAIKENHRIKLSEFGYELRQQLNKGEHTIDYFLYYCKVRKQLSQKLRESIFAKLEKLRGIDFVLEYYETVLFALVSRFGKSIINGNDFEKTAKLLFKVCFAKRLTTPLKKNTVYNFEKDEVKLIDRVIYANSIDEIKRYCEKYKVISGDISNGVIGKFVGRIGFDPSQRKQPFFNKQENDK